MRFWFLKTCIGLCLLGALGLFINLEFQFPIDSVGYLANKLGRSYLETKYLLQAVSILFLWFAGLFGLVLFSKLSIKTVETSN
jgi:hypothetical protein